MSNIFRIKRRVSGGAGAPATLSNGELAYNEVDNILYYGSGVATGVTAAVVIAIGGSGILNGYVSLAGAQNITGNKNFTGVVTVALAPVNDNTSLAASTAWVQTYAQPKAVNLTSLSNLATLGLVSQTSAGVFTARTITGTAGRTTVTNGDAIAGNTTIDLAVLADSGAGSLLKITRDTYGRVAGTAVVLAADITNALGFTPENLANKGVANGYAGLDGAGKVLLAQLPASVIGALNYQGVWNASTNTPAIVNGVGTKGFYYKVSVAGNTTIDGFGNWTVGDLIIFDGTTWDKTEGGNPDVSSVAGRVGAIVLTTADVGGLGTMATQNAGAVAITGGSVVGSTVTGNITGNAANVTNTVAVANGGTGAVTLTGYVKGAGTAVMTASTTIPVADITGLGTMATQNAATVNITGGAIDNIVFDGGTF